MSEYVTVVSVDLQPMMTNSTSLTSDIEKKSSFVTVLSINYQNNANMNSEDNPSVGEIVTVYRLPGERLGFGLKFQGGTKTDEKVQRLFIQSCDIDSPASRARASWGALSEGDEIFQIESEPVTDMTRIECVKRLKDKNIAINLLVQRAPLNGLNSIKEGNSSKKRPQPPPPPVIPPRKIIKKLYSRDQLSATVENPTPVAAEMYLNTLEDEKNFNDESDGTESTSTISSQISVLSNFSSENDLTMNGNDITKILTKPFQMIEREFNVNSSNDSVSIDNLLLFNNVELIDIDGKEKINFENKLSNSSEKQDIIIRVDEDESRSYENIGIKLPPIPRPRSISLPLQDISEVDAKTPTKTIESWLKEAKTLNGNTTKTDKFVKTDDHEQNYEQTKFECFAAGDDEEDSWPPELLTISEAYFNFPWCGNPNSNLPTIGEAEEELSSMENMGNDPKITIKGPVFIVSTTNFSEDEVKHSIVEVDSTCSPLAKMEINNNHHSYQMKDKNDIADKKFQTRNNIIPITAEQGTSCLEQVFIKNSTKSNILLTNNIFNENDFNNKELISHHKFVEKRSKNRMQSITDSEKKHCESLVDNRDLIKNDKETKDEGNSAKNIIASLTSEKGARSFEAEEENSKNNMAYLAAATVIHDQNLLTILEGSRLPPEGREYPLKIPTNEAFPENQKNSTEVSKRKPVTMTKATAIVAPLTPRKMQNFDEISNFVDTKPPFKSVTLGRPRVINNRNKDEKSEKSVRDKIAMFSNSTSDISHILPRTQLTLKEKSKSLSNRIGYTAKSTENIFISNENKSNVGPKILKKKAMSVENLDNYDSEEVASKKFDLELNYKAVNKPPSLHSPALSARPLSLKVGKAQSVENLIEPYDTSILSQIKPPSTAPALSRRISFSGYSNDHEEDKPRNSLLNILENRRKGLSKLRGLVIPEKKLETDPELLGLPVIRSREFDLIKQASEKTPPRNSLHQKLDTKTTKLFTELVKSPPIKPPRTSLAVQNKSSTTDESDTESCNSCQKSTQLESPIAKKPVMRTISSETNTSISSNSTLTSGSGSQASCSSIASTLEGQKMPKEISSRKTIVASSKSRSGREILQKSWRDEDSTDGGVNNEDRKRVPKAKVRNSLVNYKVVSGEKSVGRDINVATCVEVVSTDSDEKLDASETNPVPFCEKKNLKILNKQGVPQQVNIISDMAKWVRNETTKTTMEKATDIKPKFIEAPKKISLSEIRKNFESKTNVSPPLKTHKDKTPNSNHNRFSSWESIASSSSGVSSELLGIGSGTNNTESLQTLQSDFGSFSSFGSSHSLITPQDLQLIIDEADPPLEVPEAFIVILVRETPESSIGITLAGGSDYESKEITIHRILANSPADKDGRLKRGDRILSINALSMRGLTHRESLSVLKSPRVDVVMVVTRSKSLSQTDSKTHRESLNAFSLSEKGKTGFAEVDRIPTQTSIDVDTDTRLLKANEIERVSIVKDGAGLGFSIEGGFDSPMGNVPLVVKKIFMGGAAERSSNLKVGDELLKINDNLLARQTRIDVWNLIKKLPQGNPVELTIKRK